MAFQKVVSVVLKSRSIQNLCCSSSSNCQVSYIICFYYFELWFLCTRSRSTWKHC